MRNELASVLVEKFCFDRINLWLYFNEKRGTLLITKIKMSF
jgi:hypothetical protein